MKLVTIKSVDELPRGEILDYSLTTLNGANKQLTVTLTDGRFFVIDYEYSLRLSVEAPPKLVKRHCVRYEVFGNVLFAYFEHKYDAEKFCGRLDAKDLEHTTAEVELPEDDVRTSDEDIPF